jgi:hypothetical protein
VNGRFAGVALSCSVALCQGTVRITRQELVTVHRGKRTVRKVQTVVLASAGYLLRAGQHTTVQLRFSAATVAAIERARGHRQSAHLSVSVAGGAPLSDGVVLEIPTRRR